MVFKKIIITNQLLYLQQVTTDFDFLQEMESEGDGFEEASDFDFSPSSADTFATLKPGRKSVIPNYNNNNDETLVEQGWYWIFYYNVFIGFIIQS